MPNAGQLSLAFKKCHLRTTLSRDHLCFAALGRLCSLRSLRRKSCLPLTSGQTVLRSASHAIQKHSITPNWQSVCGNLATCHLRNTPRVIVLRGRMPCSKYDDHSAQSTSDRHRSIKLAQSLMLLAGRSAVHAASPQQQCDSGDLGRCSARRTPHFSNECMATISGPCSPSAKPPEVRP